MGQKFDVLTKNRWVCRTTLSIELRMHLPFGPGPTRDLVIPVEVIGVMPTVQGAPAMTQWLPGPWGGRIPFLRPAHVTGDVDYIVGPAQWDPDDPTFVPLNLRSGTVGVSVLAGRLTGSFDVDGSGGKAPLTGPATETAPDVYEFTAGSYKVRLALSGRPEEPIPFDPPR
jgi:hypothetical protein